MPSGVLPSRSTWSAPAPRVSSTSASTECLCWMASASGVRPPLSLVSIGTPAAKCRSTICTSPLTDASSSRDSGVVAASSLPSRVPEPVRLWVAARGGGACSLEAVCTDAIQLLSPASSSSSKVGERLSAALLAPPECPSFCSPLACLG